MSFSYHPTSKEGIQGIPVAAIRGGQRDGTVVYLHPHSKSLDEEMDAEEMRYLISKIIDDLVQMHRMRIPTTKLLDLEQDILNNLEPKDSKLKLIYNEVKAIIKKKSAREVYLDDDDESYFDPIPEIAPNQRQNLFISGASGSGKSTLAATYAKNWLEDFPGSKVYLLSCKDEDPALDCIRELERIPLNKDLAYECRKGNIVDTFTDSLVILDDIEGITDKAILEAVNIIKNDIMKLGRAKNIWIVSIMHKGLGGAQTKTDLSEANVLALFPKSNPAEAKKVLKNYAGLEGFALDKTLKQRSRWVWYRRGHPNYVLSEKSLYLI